MLVNICMKIHEDTLLLRGHDIVLETATYKVQTGITLKSVYIRVMVLVLCMLSNVG